MLTDSVLTLPEVSTQFQVAITVDSKKIDLDEVIEYYIDARSGDVSLVSLITKNVLYLLSTLEMADSAVINISRLDNKMNILGSHSIGINPNVVSYGSSLDNNSTYVLEFVMI